MSRTTYNHAEDGSSNLPVGGSANVFSICGVYRKRDCSDFELKVFTIAGRGLVVYSTEIEGDGNLADATNADKSGSFIVPWKQWGQKVLVAEALTCQVLVEGGDETLRWFRVAESSNHFSTVPVVRPTPMRSLGQSNGGAGAEGGGGATFDVSGVYRKEDGSGLQLGRSPRSVSDVWARFGGRELRN